MKVRFKHVVYGKVKSMKHVVVMILLIDNLLHNKVVFVFCFHIFFSFYKQDVGYASCVDQGQDSVPHATEFCSFY